LKYNQPYGISDPNAPYINGNPSTGTMGSIPPAASIEHPQREIVNLITDAAMAPSSTDLHQLARGVQGGHLNYAIDNGTANQYSINVNPPLLAYAAGQRWTVRILNTNTGPSTININGLGARHIVFPQGGELIGGELFAGGLASLVDDGTNLQLATGGGATTTVTSSILNAPKDYYVNGTTGDDTLRDGLSATVGVGKTGPFKTLQRAQAETVKYNLNGFSINIHIADGTYTGPVNCGIVNGVGTIYYIGNVNNPAAVLVTNSTGFCFAVTGTLYDFDGIKVTTTPPGAGPDTGNCFSIINQGSVVLHRIDFGPCNDNHIATDAGSFLYYFGPITISGGAGQCHIFAGSGSYVRQSGRTPTPVNIIAPVNFAYAVVQAAPLGSMLATWSTTGYGNVSGRKFLAYGNGVINSQGAGVNHYPGTVAGTLQSGGQYL
jgi:hypothetical protein